MHNRVGNPVLTGDNLMRIAAVETHLLRSERIKQTFKIQVAQPAMRKNETRRFPVVYVTDGNWVFDMFKSISWLLQMTTDDAPPFILVSIGYPSDEFHAGMVLRLRELTYPPYMNVDFKAVLDILKKGEIGNYEGMLLPEEGAKFIHGGENFRRFISEDVVPLIDRTYPTSPGERTYFGHSGGGYFGLYTLFTESSLFKNYIVSSPGLLYHGTGPDGVSYHYYDPGLQMLRTFLESGKSLEGISLYMSAGGEEEYERMLGAWQMLSGFYQFAKTVKNAQIPGLKFMTEVVAGETHNTVWPIAFIHGVQVMLGTRRFIQ
jgi:enterochelin esterase-like enzyme